MCITMLKKGYAMNNKFSNSTSYDPNTLDLTAAVEQFVAKGGVIDVIPDTESVDSSSEPSIACAALCPAEPDRQAKAEQLKGLVAKGAGVCALQYSLKMNKKEIRQLAVEHGVKIAFSRPILEIKREARQDPSEIDDVVAGHAMHFSSLGYTAQEIAQMLGLNLRQVWNIGKAYRIEFKHSNEDPDLT